MNVDPKVLLAKIGMLVVENDMLRAKVQEQQLQVSQLIEQLLGKPENNGQHQNRLTEAVNHGE